MIKKFAAMLAVAIGLSTWLTPAFAAGASLTATATIITVEEARGLETEMEVVEGMQFDRGYLSPYFVNDAERIMISAAGRSMANFASCSASA